MASAPDFVVALNHPSGRPSAPFVTGGQMLYNRTGGELISRGDISMFPVPANKIAGDGKRALG